MKKKYPSLQIGIAKHQVYFETASPTFWNTMLKRIADYVWNEWWLNRIQNFQDFIGLNHYNRNVIDGWYGKNPNRVQTDFGWEFWPESLEFAVRELSGYGKPIYITENGLADANDTLREQFLPRALAALHRSLQAGADVRGYMYWSLLDNFEWDKGFWPRFGLIAVDRSTQERVVRPSALQYAAIVRGSGLD
jgi:beta-glucosidase